MLVLLFSTLLFYGATVSEGKRELKIFYSNYKIVNLNNEYQSTEKLMLSH